MADLDVKSFVMSTIRINVVCIGYWLLGIGYWVLVIGVRRNAIAQQVGRAIAPEKDIRLEVDLTTAAWASPR